jgi:uncharacterized iron-regulated membrane protein
MMPPVMDLETYTMLAMAASSIAFIAAGIYLHLLRKRSERVFPAPFLNPHGRRKPGKR